MSIRYIPDNAKGLHVANMAFGAAAPVTVYPIGAYDISIEGTGVEKFPVEKQQLLGQRGPIDHVKGADIAMLKFAMPLRGGAEYGDTVGTPELSRLLPGCGMVEKVIAAGPACVDGATANTVKDFDVAPAFLGIVVGDSIIIEGASTPAQMRQVIKKEDLGGNVTELTVFPNWDTIPSAGDSLKPTRTYTPITGIPSTYLGLRQSNGVLTSNIWQAILNSCVGKWSIPETQSNAIPSIQFELMGDSWTHAVDKEDYTEEAFKPGWPLLSSCFWMSATAKVQIGSFGFDPGLDSSALPSTCGGNGRAGFFFGESAPSITVTPYHDEDLWTAMVAGTKYPLFFESTLDEDRAWCVYVGSAEILEIGQPSLGDKVMGAQPKFGICDPGLNEDDDPLPKFSFAIAG